MKKYIISLACLSFAFLCVEGRAASLPRRPAKALPSPLKGKPTPKKGKFPGSLKRHHCEEKTFISAVANGDGFSNQFVVSGSAILFNTVVDSDGAVTYNATTGVFTVRCAGSYEITYGATWVGEGNATNIALRFNGVVVPAASILDNPSGTDSVTMSLIVELSTDSTIEVIADGAAIALVDPSGISTSAFVTIEKVDSEG
jgi:hypothetical protein